MFLIILLFIVSGVYLWQRKKSSKFTDLPPTYPGALPVVGHGYLLLGDTKDLWNIIKQCAEYTLRSEKRTVMVFIGSQKYYFMTDPDECYTALSVFLEKLNIYEYLKPWLGVGLVTAPLSIWKQDRKLLNPSFNQKPHNGFLKTFNSKSRKLVQVVKSKAGKGPFDVTFHLSEIGLETIYKTATGMELQRDNKQDMEYSDAIQHTLNIVTQRAYKFWLHNDFLWKYSSLKVSFDKYVSSMRRFTDEIIKRRRLQRINQSAAEYDGKMKTFLDILLDLKTDSNNMISDNAVNEHMDTIIAAGHETISTTLVFTLVLIGSYHKVQQRLYEELQEIIGNDDRDVEKEDLSRLVYLEAVLKESCRLYPVVPIFGRNVEKEMRLKNYALYSGMSCIICGYAAHRHPAWGEDANEFNPDRWLNVDTLPKNRNLYFPFGFGKRSCLGYQYAMISMKTTLVHFLRNYRITADHTNMVLKFDFLLKPDSGHHISIERRS